MTRTSKALAALAALLGPALAWAEVRQELDLKLQQRTQKTFNGAPSAIPAEYGEIPNGFVLERYKVDYDSEKYGFGAEVTNVGKDNQSIAAEGGRPGSMEWKLEMDLMPHLFSNEARSPFSYQGNGVMQLNGGWRNTALTASNNAFNAGVSTALAGTPYAGLGFDVETDALELRFRPAQDFVVELGGWRQTRRGTRAQPASFGFSNAIELAAPIDWAAHEAFLDMELAKKSWQLGFNYRLSDFNNKIPNLFWDNPKRMTDQYVNSSHYSAGDGGARGMLANAPDNGAHSLRLEGGVNLPKDTRFSFETGWQRWSAFNPMLPYTQNSQMNPGNASAAAAGLTFPAYDPAFRPDPNVDSAMEVFTYMGRLSGRPLSWLRASLVHDAYILEGKGVQYTLPGFAVLDQVWNGGTVRTPRENVRDDKTILKLDYDVNSWLSGNLGLQHKYMKVTREIDKSREEQANAGFTLRPSRRLFLNLSYLLSLRRSKGMDLQTYPTTVSQYTGRTYYTEAPGLRRLDVADRNRNQARAQLQWTPGEASFALSARVTEDKYRQGKGDLTGGDALVYPGTFGLTSDTSKAAGFDVSLPAGGAVTADAYYEFDQSKRYLRSSQTACAGSPSGSTVNTFTLPGEPACSSANAVVSVMLQDPRTRWETRLTENSHIAGLGLTWLPTGRSLAFLGYDFVYTRFNGDPVSNGAFVANYRPFETSRRMQQNVRVRGEYKLLEGLTLAANYLYEKFDAADFQYKEVPLRDSSKASIFLGASPVRNYYAHTVSMGMNYKF